MDDSGEKKRNAPVSTSPEMCDEGGSTLLERLAATAEFGSRVTRRHDHNKLFVPQVVP